MQTVSSVTQLRDALATWRKNGERIAFVPTMGNLHSGHFSLVKEAKKHAERVVVSIFVNPMQFGKNEDLDSYPRTLAADSEGLNALGVDVLFTPTVDVMYPNGLDAQTFIEVPGVSDGYCGASRPGHFRGVATVVNKLFNLVQPDVACFGEKDFQQLQVIKTMVADLAMPVQVIGVPTERDEHGLALSSRNGYLSDAQKQLATTLYRTMVQSKADLVAKQLTIAEIEQKAQSQLNQAGLQVDYYTLAKRTNLTPATESDTDLVILAAVFLGKVRLIDNLQISL